MPSRLFKQRALSCMAIAGCLLAGMPAASFAQSTPGFTLWSGVKDRDDLLSYYLDFGGRRGSFDRYRLRIPAKKMKLAVAQLNISYPDYYKGTFNTKEVEVIVKGKSIPLQEVVWNKENHLIEIYPAEPIPSGNSIEVQLSDVRNPDFGGTFYFNCTVVSPGDVPLPRYLGTWIISVS
jgi:hypothetical protein